MPYTRIADNIYRDSRTGNFYERPFIQGRRTWRKLDGHTLKLAKESLAQRRTDAARATRGMARDPYAPPPLPCGELLRAYENARCPDTGQRPMQGDQLAHEVYRIEKLLPFWKHRLIDTINIGPDASRYFSFRQNQRKSEAFHGGRAVDLELMTLRRALRWAVSTGRISAIPAGAWPKFRDRNIRHCRDLAPLDADELHAVARFLFENSRSQALGWQLLLEAMTGCRTSEVLALRWDAAARQPGFIDGDYLWLKRAKGGVNPFALIHPALRQCLEMMKVWRQTRPFARKSPWLIPSHRRPGFPVKRQSLVHALAIAGPIVVDRKLTSHGLRSFYVTVRRSQGIADAQIAAEIGDKSGAAIIVSTYGAIPPNWRGADALDWLPKQSQDTAWSALSLPQNMVPIECDYLGEAI